MINDKLQLSATRECDVRDEVLKTEVFLDFVTSDLLLKKSWPFKECALYYFFFTFYKNIVISYESSKLKLLESSSAYFYICIISKLLLLFKGIHNLKE